MLLREIFTIKSLFALAEEEVYETGRTLCLRMVGLSPLAAVLARPAIAFAAQQLKAPACTLLSFTSIFTVLCLSIQALC
jgi:hypothetical protein